MIFFFLIKYGKRFYFWGFCICCFFSFLSHNAGPNAKASSSEKPSLTTRLKNTPSFIHIHAFILFTTCHTL